MKVRRVESRLAEVVAEYDARSSLRTSDSVYELLAGMIETEAVEVFVAVLLNGKHKPTGIVEVSRGTLSTSLVHPREVFGPALRMGAVAAIIVAHNHPSGDPTPSVEDIEVTRRLIQGGELLGIQVLDHVVIGDGRHHSIRQSKPTLWE